MTSRENFKIGDAVVFIHGRNIIEGVVTGLGRARANVSARKPRRARFLVSYNALYHDINEFLEDTRKIIDDLGDQEWNDEEIRQLKDIVAKKYHHIYSDVFSERELELLRHVETRWGKRRTFRTAGRYNPATNEIQVSPSLKRCPAFVLEKVLHHELLHVHFRFHDRDFRRLEARCETYEEAREFISALFQYLRIKPLLDALVRGMDARK